MVAALLVVGALALGGTYASADHRGCPPFERLRYDYFLESHHGGDLYSTVHVVGFTLFRFCYETRDQVTQEEVRWDARGGEYVLRLTGEGVDDTHVLRPGQNATGWYEHGAIERVQILGLSARGEPTVVPAEPPPALAALPRLR